jgi:hypothetical protein
MMKLPIFNQGDVRWASKHLGTSKATMRDSGCFTSAVAVAMNNYGHQIDPGQLCDQLSANGGYDADGLLEWNVLEKLYPDLVLADAFDTTDMNTSGSHVLIDVAMKRIQSLVRMGIPVLITVDVPGVNSPGQSDHIICCTDAENWLCNDSNGGVEVKFAPNFPYGPPEKAIFGARILVGAPTSFPDSSDERDKRDAVALWKASQVMRGRHVPTYAKEIVDSFLGK